MGKIIKKLIYYLYSLRIRLILNRKITGIYNSLPIKISLTNKNISDHKRTWDKLHSTPNLKWYKVYASINGNTSPYYITETDYYTKVELILNNRAFSEAYCDKNFYHNYLDNAILPKVYLRNIQGEFYSGNYQAISHTVDINTFIPAEVEKLIIKKSIDSGGGRSVTLFSRIEQEWKNSEGDILNGDYLKRCFKRNFILQEYIDQHPFYSQFNSSSVNTVRLLTYRSVKTNEIIPLQAVFRIGQPGSIVDNQAAGGIACGINTNGILNEFGINKKGFRFLNFNGIAFSEVSPVFKYHEIVELGKQLAQKYYYHRLLGFDFCLDKDGNIKLIEINNKNNEINFYQMNNGPLFGKYTDEVIEYCTKQPANFCFDFEI